MQKTLLSLFLENFFPDSSDNENYGQNGIEQSQGNEILNSGVFESSDLVDSGTIGVSKSEVLTSALFIQEKLTDKTKRYSVVFAPSAPDTSAIDLSKSNVSMQFTDDNFKIAPTINISVISNDKSLRYPISDHHQNQQVNCCGSKLTFVSEIFTNSNRENRSLTELKDVPLADQHYQGDPSAQISSTSSQDEPKQVKI